MATWKELLGKVKPAALQVKEFGAKAADVFTGIPTVARSTADAYVSRQFQPQFEAQNRRNADLDNLLNKRAQELRLKGDRSAAQRLTQMTGNRLDLERDSLGRNLTTPEQARGGFTRLASAASMMYNPGAVGLAQTGRLVPQAVATQGAKQFATKLGANTAAKKLGTWGAIRGAENALPGAAVNIATGQDAATTAKQAAGDFAMGFGINSLLSPRLLKEAAQEFSGAQVKAGRNAVMGTLGGQTAALSDDVKLKNRSFTEGARTSPDLQNTAKVLPQDQYGVRDTGNLGQRAIDAVDQDIEGVFGRLRRNGITNDEDLAQAIKVAEKFDAQGRADDAAELILSASEQLTKAGQFVQAASLMNRLSESGAEVWAKRLAKQAGKELTPEQVTKVRDLARGVKTMREGLEGARELGKDPKTITAMERNANVAVQKLTEGVASLNPSGAADQAYAVWKAGLLTGLKTSGLNTAANTSQAVLKTASDPISALFDMVISIGSGERTKTATLAGRGKGAAKGVSEGWDYLISGYDPRAMGSKSADLGKSGVTQFSDNILGRVAKGYSESIFRFIGAQDRPFYYSALYNSLEDQGRAAAKNQKVSGKALKPFLKNFVENPTTEAAQRAAKEAERSVFQNDTALGAIARKLQQNPIAKWVVPFGKTPSAVITEAFNYTPVGAVAEVASQIKAGKLDQRALAEALGKANTGAAILWLGAKMNEAGMVNGAYPTDQSERARWEAENRKPGTVDFGNGVQIDLQSFGNAGQVLAIGAGINKAANGGADPVGAGLQGAMTAGNQLLESPFLSGTSSLIEAVKDPANFGQRFVSQQAGSTVPTMVSDIAQVNDQDASGETRAVKPQGIKESLKARIPGLRNQLPQEVDILGRPRTTGRGDFQTIADPFRSTNLRRDGVTDEIARLGDTPSITKPDKKTKNLQGEPFDRQGMRDFTQQAGTMFAQDARSLISSPAYQALNEEQKAKALSDLYSGAKDSAKKGLATNSVSTYKPVSGTDRPSKVQADMAKALIESGKQDVVRINDRYGYRLDPESGEVKMYDKKKLDLSARKQTIETEIDTAIDNVDPKGYVTALEKKYNSLQETLQYLDPEFDSGKITEVQRQLENMIQTGVKKYQSLSKAKAGKKGRKVAVGAFPKMNTKVVRSKRKPVKRPLPVNVSLPTKRNLFT